MNAQDLLTKIEADEGKVVHHWRIEGNELVVIFVDFSKKRYPITPVVVPAPATRDPAPPVKVQPRPVKTKK